MGLEIHQLQELMRSTPETAWQSIVSSTLRICEQPLTVSRAGSELTKRDREVGALDHFLAATAWELWSKFGEAVGRNAEQVVKWWSQPHTGKAVLILDGLSLRELPWLVEYAETHGLKVHKATAYGAEIPSETNTFARALGFNSRSQLQNNGGGKSHRLTPATTESIDLPWQDCGALINASQNWIFWHQWPDNELHGKSGAGQGLEALTPKIAAQLTSPDFWKFVERLATGRRVVITSDHGYAATGLFFDATEAQGKFLKSTLRSGRAREGAHDPGPFMPPVALQMNARHGDHLVAVGRWKWRSPGGYPTLAHGGLSLLEMLCPFVEISKQGTEV